ncbi:hypothetical protein GCM10010430_55290 [Kitasatospora cystarginea]|uniref:Uncharacterized protein n=1 Tax=Kitasatospora cystarginea TaxID=58350 RepID=A0ABP5RN69_9ACTN
MSDDRPTPDLQAICDVCLQLIGDEEGAVWVDQDAAHNEAQMPVSKVDEGGFEVLDLTNLPAEVKWRTTHTTCQDAPAWAYAIPVERIRTWPALLHWSVHLMDKRWLEATDWQLFVLRSLEPKLGGISGLRPLRPQGLDWLGIGGD